MYLIQGAFYVTSGIWSLHGFDENTNNFNALVKQFFMKLSDFQLVVSGKISLNKFFFLDVC